MEELSRQLDQIVQWLKTNTQQANAEGLVAGISGGVDSAVVGALIKRAFPESSLGLILPCHSNPRDNEHGNLVCNTLGLYYKVLDLTSAHDAILHQTLTSLDKEAVDIRSADSNLRARLRMSALYTIANALNYLVVGTDNAAEFWTGYFTKYGDGGCDLLPIAQYTKGEVRQLAQILEIPPEIVHKAPSAGLWPGQTDEEELGITYQVIDDYLRNQPISRADEQRINNLHANSEHKRQCPPVFCRGINTPQRLKE